MRTKRIALAIALCAFAAMGAFAEGVDPVFAHPLNDSSRASLSASFGRLSDKPVVSGSFTQTKRIKRLGRNLVSKGDFLFSVEDGVYWNIRSPYPSTLILTAKRLVQRSATGEESVMDSSDNLVFKRIAGTMQSVFSGDLSALEDEFSVYFQGDLSAWHVGLVPKEKTVRDVIASIVVEGSESITNLKLAEGSGDVVSYAFTTAKTADGLTEAERGLFVF
jgi:outer membrane lipoprotein carrier protein